MTDDIVALDFSIFCNDRANYTWPFWLFLGLFLAILGQFWTVLGKIKLSVTVQP